jgi:hypothetical protein
MAEFLISIDDSLAPGIVATAALEGKTPEEVVNEYAEPHLATQDMPRPQGRPLSTPAPSRPSSMQTAPCSVLSPSLNLSPRSLLLQRRSRALTPENLRR